MATTTKTKTKTEDKSSAPAAAAAAAAETAITAPDFSSKELAEFDYGDDEGKGFENQNMSDRKIPMIVVMQSNAKAVKDRKALSGQLLNSVTGEAYDTIEFVPSITDHVHIEWVPRDSGGGYRGRHVLGSPITAKAIERNGGKTIGKLVVPSVGKDDKGKDLPDTELVETFEIAGVLYQAWRDGKPLLDGDDAAMPIVIAFKSSAIKFYREWSSNVGMFLLSYIDKTTGQKRKKKVPLFGHRVRMSTKPDQNAKGDFFVPQLAPAEGDIIKSLLHQTDPRYLAARMLHEQYIKGVVRAAYETTDQGDGEGGSSSSAAGAAPF